MTLPGHYGNNKLIITPGGKIGRCPGFQYEFSPLIPGCCCFLDPGPLDWNTETEYQNGDCVSYDSDTWYSTLVGVNTGNEPGVDAGWSKYTHCDNEDWNSFPPFGGIGKTPKYMIMTLKGHIETSTYYYDWEITAVLIWTSTLCRFGYGGEGTLTGTYSGQYKDGDEWIPYGGEIFVGGTVGVHYDAYLTIRQIHSSGPPVVYGCGSDVVFRIEQSPGLEVWQYARVAVATDDLIEACKITNSQDVTLQQIDYVDPPGYNVPGHISWRPLDCDYEVWDETKTYNYDDCVTANGKFYRSCYNGNLNKPPVDGSPADCDVQGCVVSQVWSPTAAYSIDTCVYYNGHFYKSCGDGLGGPVYGHAPESDATYVCEPGYYWRRLEWWRTV